jgi:hypothetical protein
MARLAFLAHGDHTALDAAIDACLARTERTLQTRWRTIGCRPGRLRGPADPGPASHLQRQPLQRRQGRAQGAPGARGETTNRSIPPLVIRR